MCALGERSSRPSVSAACTLGPRALGDLHTQRSAAPRLGASRGPATGRWEVPAALQDGAPPVRAVSPLRVGQGLPVPPCSTEVDGSGRPGPSGTGGHGPVLQSWAGLPAPVACRVMPAPCWAPSSAVGRCSDSATPTRECFSRRPRRLPLVLTPPALPPERASAGPPHLSPPNAPPCLWPGHHPECGSGGEGGLIYVYV